MSGKEQEPMQQPAPTQKTRKGHTIPVPKRSDLMDAFRKIIRPVKNGR
jgi:hypothetical protein